jgi:hypothetical protein
MILTSLSFPNHICVIVHYRAWTESSQHKFEDTWNEQRPIELVLGKGICYMTLILFSFLFFSFLEMNKISA